MWQACGDTAPDRAQLARGKQMETPLLIEHNSCAVSLHSSGAHASLAEITGKKLSALIAYRLPLLEGDPSDARKTRLPTNAHAVSMIGLDTSC
jgi:hypothetical protein